MAIISIHNQNSNISIGSTLRRMWETSRLFSLTLVVFLVLIPVSAIGVTLNPAEIDGVRIWIKPLKFSISVLVYSTTLLWMLSLIIRWRWLAKVVAVGVSVNLLFDMVWVATQTLRGVRSHFNFTTSFDSAFYSAVGTSINIVVMLNFAAIIAVLAQRLENKPLQWALIMGLLATVVGGFSAIPMTMPSVTQMAALESGADLDVIGAHSVGVEDGGPGLPFVGWSMEGGDIRVAHFFGLHGLQIVPLLGLYLNRRWHERLSSGQRSGIVLVVGIGYIGTTLLLLWQALRGQSVIAPDVTSLAAFSAMFTVSGVLIYLIQRIDFRPNHAPLTQL